MTRLNVPVGEFTTPNPITATEQMSMDELRSLMDAHGVRHLPVVREGTVTGIVSDRDVRVVAGLALEQQRQVRAADIMVADPVTVRASMPLDDVAFIMSDRRIGSVIVNGVEGTLLGIFTVTDALNALIEIARADSGRA